MVLPQETITPTVAATEGNAAVPSHAAASGQGAKPDQKFLEDVLNLVRQLHQVGHRILDHEELVRAHINRLQTTAKLKEVSAMATTDRTEGTCLRVLKKLLHYEQAKNAYDRALAKKALLKKREQLDRALDEAINATNRLQHREL